MHHLTETQCTTAIIALRASFTHHTNHERLMRAEAQRQAELRNREAQATFNRVADRFAALAQDADTLAEDLAHGRLTTDTLARIADNADASFDPPPTACEETLGTAPYFTD